MYYCFSDAHWVKTLGITLADVDAIFTQVNMNNDEQRIFVKIILILNITNQNAFKKSKHFQMKEYET